MSYGNPTYLLQRLAYRKKPPLPAEHRCGNRACPIHTTRLYTGADGVRRCLRCHDLYGQQQAWEQVPEPARGQPHQGRGNRGNGAVPPQDRQLIRDLFMSGMTEQQIVDETGYSVSTVRKYKGVGL